MATDKICKDCGTELDVLDVGYVMEDYHKSVIIFDELGEIHTFIDCEVLKEL